MPKPIIVLLILCIATPQCLADPLLLEAESFQPTSPGWQSKPWGTNYCAATLANTFLSRKAYLGAPEQCDPTHATLTITIPKPGKYLALVRYEAVHKHQTQFRLQITQSNQTKLNRQYGALENTKIWAFKQGLKKEAVWDWGAVENIVWEGHDAAVDLEGGPATLILSAEKQPSPAARRHVDCILLTTDTKDVEERIAKENYLPLDGLLTQAGDLYARVHNATNGEVKVTFPNGTEHSPYWVHHRTWKPKIITAAPNQTTDWIEVGHLLDTLNDGQWRLTVEPKDTTIDLEFGVPTGEGVRPVRRFEKLANQPELAYDADTRATKRIRLTEEILYDLVNDLKQRPVAGTSPRRTLVYGHTFPPRPGNPKYTAALKEFVELMGVPALAAGRTEDLPADPNLRKGYVDLRSVPTEKLEDHCRNLANKNEIAVVSLGDEINLPKPPDNPKTQEAFRQWLSTAAPDRLNLRFDPGDKSNPVQFYYSHLFTHHHGIQALKQRTDIIRKHLPHAGVGANFSPHGPAYLGDTHHWITVFRESGMTMPWGEDYVWQPPVGTQQFTALMLDMFRAGIANHPDRKIHFYVMPHSPGNTPSAWRRQFHTAVAHGAKVFNLFEFRPVQFAYTENYVNSPDMYQAVRVAMHELGKYEDILQAGHVRPAQVGLWFSQAADVWQDNEPPFGAGKRTLYIALRHRQIPIDCVLEGDDLSKYKAIYLTDRHVSRAAAKALAQWVRSGGHLVTTAGAGMRDEFDQPNTAMRDLLGFEEKQLLVTDPIHWEKQDLPYARPIDTLKLHRPVPILGAKSITTAAEPGFTFQSDNSPALVLGTIGHGKITAFSFLPGLSYFHPALPIRPLDRGATDQAFSHFLPTEFDAQVADLLALPAIDAGAERPIKSSDPLIDATMIESPAGQMIPLVNWRPHGIQNFKVTVDKPKQWTSISLASGAKVKLESGRDGLTCTFDLDVADVLILRP